MTQHEPGPAARRGSVTRAGAASRIALTLGLALRPGSALPADEFRNWFNDPFFQISNAITDCPPPAGPFISEAERAVQAHHRAEKGTTCWLAGQCERPNAHAYDGDIAAAFKAAWPIDSSLRETTLWVTVQGRVVYIEGCVGEASAAPRLEAFARRLPYVQQAIALVRDERGARVPYKIRGTVAADPSPVPDNPRPP